MNENHTEFDQIEWRELLGKLRGDVPEVDQLLEDDVYTKAGRMKKSSVSRKLGITVKGVNELLAKLAESATRYM